MDKITVIVPIYNIDQYLEKCVYSIINQSYTNLDILLVDDGSIDESSTICDRLANEDSRVRVVHKENEGTSIARNVGIDHAKGSYITFVDGDDFIDVDMVNQLYETLSSNQCDISVCGLTRFNDGQNPISNLQPNETRVISNEAAIEDMLYQRNIVLGPVGKLYKKNLFESIRFSEELMIAEDADINYKIFSRASRVAVNSSTKYYYLQRRGSAIHMPFSMKRMDGLTVMKGILKDVATNRPSTLDAARSRLFIEAIYIATEISYTDRQYKHELNECIQLIHALSRDLINSGNTRNRYRQYAIVGLVSANLLVALLKFRATVGKVKKTTHADN